MNDTSEFRRDRAWQIVLAATVGCAFGLTALPFYTLGMVAKPLAAEFGWGRAVAQSGIVFSALGVLSSAWLVGALLLMIVGNPLSGIASSPRLLPAAPRLDERGRKMRCSTWRTYGCSVGSIPRALRACGAHQLLPP